MFKLQLMEEKLRFLKGLLEEGINLVVVKGRKSFPYWKQRKVLEAINSELFQGKKPKKIKIVALSN